MCAFCRKYFGWLLLVLAVMVFVLFWYASPYCAVNSLRAAIKNHQTDAVVKFIDFPQVREGLKGQISNKVNVKMTEFGLRDSLGSIGSAITSSIADKLVDTLVTPEGFTNLLDRGPDLNLSSNRYETSKIDQTERVADSVNNESNDLDKYSWSSQYGDSMDHFYIELTDKDNPKEEVQLDLTRVGFFSWKVTNVLLPFGD